MIHLYQNVLWGEDMRQFEYYGQRISTIYYFLMVAEQKNLSKAAAILHVTQPFLSQRLSALENELHVQLFIRSHSGMILTEKGAHLRDQWSKMLDIFDDSIEQLLEEKAEHTIVGIPSIFGDDISAKLIQPMLSKYRENEISVIKYPPQEAGDWVKNKRMDLIVLPTYEELGDELDQEMEFVLVLRSRLQCSMRSDHPLCSVPELTLDRLREEQLIYLKSEWSYSYREIMKRLCAQSGFVPHFIRCDSAENVYTYILLKNAISLSLPRTFVNVEGVTTRFVEGTTALLYLGHRRNATRKQRSLAERCVKQMKTIFDEGHTKTE